VNLNKNINLVVYMDSKEMWNAGDDAKLLRIVCPDQTKQFVYAGEDQELVDYIATKNSDSVVVLFPSDYAISFWEFIQFRSASQKNQGEVATSSYPIGSSQSDTKTLIEADMQIELEVDSKTSGTQSTETKEGGAEGGGGGVESCFSSEMTIIAVDAVWRHARRMALRLRELLPAVRHVQLTPEQMSVYARSQTQSDRICTVEATALFLSHLGESRAATEALVECVRRNNEALRPRPKHSTFQRDSCRVDPRSAGANLYCKQEHATHPCWYFGACYFVPPAEKQALAREKQRDSQCQKQQAAGAILHARDSSSKQRE
jgi:DTW domain-containing protein YfiP